MPSIMSKYLILFTFLFSFLGIKAQDNGFEAIKSLELTDQIYEYLQKYYVDDINVGHMSKTAIDAMLKDLDPYTVFYHESNIEDYRLMTTGQYGGIGALIRRVDEYVYISEPYDGNPAIKSGLKAGDKILQIDGKDMKGKNTEEVSTFLKGPKGTEVEVLIERQGEKKSVKIERDEIKLPDVPYFGMIDDEIGYIALNSFTQTASQSVIKSFNDLKSQGMKKLILDLRGNGGGLLREAVNIVNLFVDKDEVVVTTKGRLAEENQVYKTNYSPLDLEIPLVVLINGSSASASEIVSGTIQDLDRGVIVGTTSFGKGLVQRTYDLDYGSKIKLTISKYYTPSGRCVQRLEYYDREDGERPKEIADSLIKVFKTRNGRDVIDGRGVEPDISVDPDEMSRLTATLLSKGLFFNYATDYYYKHDKIDAADKFRLTEKDYKNFKEFVLKEDISYTTASEEQLLKMKSVAEKEGFFEDIESDYEDLLSKVTPSTDRDLDKFESQIKSILENEIVSRYYLQEGRALHNFLDDDFMVEAINILKNSKEYNTILGN